MSGPEIEGQRPANKPAQGNALGCQFRNGGALKGRHKNRSARLSRPFKATVISHGETQGVALDWLVSHLWCFTAVARLNVRQGGTRVLPGTLGRARS